MLLNAGADVHAEDNDALYMASQKGHAEIVKILLDAGADIRVQGATYGLLNSAIKNKSSNRMS